MIRKYNDTLYRPLRLQCDVFRIAARECYSQPRGCVDLLHKLLVGCLIFEPVILKYPS